MLPMDSRRMKIASSYMKEYEQKSQSGIYGAYVCKKCEDLFAIWDDYAATVLQRSSVATAQGFDFGEYDYNKLARFFLSILWRAHACEHRFFSTVDLDSQALALENHLLNENKTALRDFDIIPSYSSNMLALGVMTPVKVSIQSVPYWQLYLPLFQALIKVVADPGAACLQPIVMTEGKNLCLVEKTFTEFGEIDIAERVVKENIKKKNDKRKKS
ncbi:MAG: hypothetical protein HGA87_03375 [Desulfobulbaceae bacterium]|nr:hypothetical protein [Desulfobulbaceae bacterium]